MALSTVTVALTLFLGGLLGGAATAAVYLTSAGPTARGTTPQVELCNARLTPTLGPLVVRLYAPGENLTRFNTSAMAAYFQDRTGRLFDISLRPAAALEDFKAEALRWGPRGAIVASFSHRALFHDAPITETGATDALAFAVYGSPCAFVSFNDDRELPCDLAGGGVAVHRDYTYLLHEIGHLVGVPDHQTQGVMGKGACHPCRERDVFTPLQLATFESWGSAQPLPPPPPGELEDVLT